MELDKFLVLDKRLSILYIEHNNVRYPFMLDTGCGMSVLDVSSITDKMTIKDTGKVMPGITIASGRVDAQIPVIEMDFKIGKQPFSDKFMVIDMSNAFNRLESDLKIKPIGLIGTRFFKENNMKIDFENETISYAN